ncbi:Uncharacterised protein [Mycobacteroides abscessus subsp. abscessus]|nr:Uncharacterised protein [Mycobacteroides abscessus subsp. abscessus]
MIAPRIAATAGGRFDERLVSAVNRTAPDAGAMNAPIACRTESRAGTLSPIRSSTKTTARPTSAGVDDNQP